MAAAAEKCDPGDSVAVEDSGALGSEMCQGQAQQPNLTPLLLLYSPHFYSFKPAPDVYLKAAAAEKCDPGNCVAVEDSGSGVGSAANAGMGLILGYVGASHIQANKKESHAKMLMAGEKSEDGRGAVLVVEEFRDVATLINAFKAARAKGEVKGGKPGAFVFSEEVIKGLKGRVWLPEGKVLVNN